MRKVYIHPTLPDGPDLGDGGIRQVIKGQVAALPDFGWEVVKDPALADVIACHIETPDQFLRMFPGKPFVTHNHGLYWHPDYAWGQEWCYKANRHAIDAIRSADMTTAVSEWVGAVLRRHTNRDVRVVKHGVSLNEWTPPDGERGRYVLWNKTRVDPICDPEPVARLAQRMPNVQFITTFLTGDDRPENVTVTNKLPFEEAKTYVRNAGVYLATTRETFGIGTLEALAAGVPVVGYRWGGQEEFIEHGVDGWLVAPDDLDGLAEGVQWALDNAAEIAPHARAKAGMFTLESAAQQYAEIYDELFERFAERKGMPRTSIIVPAYNMGDYLRDTLNSVQAQTDQDWECIIVDDASPDPRDAAIAKAYVDADERFRYIRKEQNGYLAAARNTGIEAARGRYILPLDADDKIAPQTVQLLADALDADRKTHIAYGGALFFEADGVTLRDYKHERGPGHSGWPVPFELDSFFESRGQPMPYCSMYRREAWKLTGGYRTRCRTSEDQDFWLRTTSYGFIPRQVTTLPLLYYRNRDDSMSTTEGWDNHRPWYPWVTDRSTLPAAAFRGDVANHLISVPALDPIVVSVIIPVGPGHGQLVVDAVDSVDSQTFRNWECIVVNDSGQPLPNLPQWVRVVEAGDAVDFGPELGIARERFGGVAAARNAGIEASKGALFLPLDADDFLQPRALEFMLQVHMNARDEGQTISVYSDFYEDPETEGDFKIWEAPDWDAHSLHTKGLGYGVTVLTPKVYWEAVGGYDADLPGWEDWAFALALAGKGYCSARIPLPLFTYRKHTGSRASENMAEFDAAKTAMMTKDFGADSEGHLMACGSCRAAAQAGLAAQLGQGGMGAAPGAGGVGEDSILIEYIGTRGGKQRVRGVNGPNGEIAITYPFSEIRRKFYVKPWDVMKIGSMTGQFRLAEGATLAPVMAEPMLVASGAPSRPAQSAQLPEPPPPPAAFAHQVPAPPPPPAAVAPALPPTPVPAPLPRADTQPPTAPPPMQAAAETAPVPPPAAADSTAVEIPEGWVSEPQMQAMKRTTLDTYAGSRGLEGAEALRSKDEVIRALAGLKQMREEFGG